MNLTDATSSMVTLKNEMIQKINTAIEEFEQQTALVVSALHIDMSRRCLQAKFNDAYPPALNRNDVEIQLIERQ